MNAYRLPLLATALLGAATMGMNVETARAQEPDTPRCFAELTSPPDPCADWEAPGSKRMVAHRGEVGGGSIEFITPDQGWVDADAIVRDEDGQILLDLRSTTWTHMPVIHVGEFGAEEVRSVVWLRDDLDGDGKFDDVAPGATTRTGPNGNVVHLVTIRLDRVPADDPSFINRDKYYITPNGSWKFCIAVGMFQK